MNTDIRSIVKQMKEYTSQLREQNLSLTSIQRNSNLEEVKRNIEKQGIRFYKYEIGDEGYIHFNFDSTFIVNESAKILDVSSSESMSFILDNNIYVHYNPTYYRNEQWIKSRINEREFSNLSKGDNYIIQGIVVELLYTFYEDFKHIEKYKIWIRATKKR